MKPVGFMSDYARNTVPTVWGLLTFLAIVTFITIIVCFLCDVACGLGQREIVQKIRNKAATAELTPADVNNIVFANYVDSLDPNTFELGEMKRYKSGIRGMLLRDARIRKTETTRAWLQTQIRGLKPALAAADLLLNDDGSYTLWAGGEPNEP